MLAWELLLMEATSQEPSIIFSFGLNEFAIQFEDDKTVYYVNTVWTPNFEKRY